MRKTSIADNIDWISIGLYFLLAIIGITFVYSTTYSPANPSLFNFNTSYGKQIIWLGISIITIALILIVDSKFYTSFALFIYLAILLILVSVLLFGVTINGSKSWFAIGPIRFQPAEIAKFATCLALAKYLTGVNVNLEKWKEKGIAIAFIAAPVFLILKQGDVGSALVFSSLIFVLHREGLENGYLIVGFGLIIVSVLALLFSPIALIIAYISFFLIFLYYNPKLKQPIFSVLGVISSVAIFVFLYNKFLVNFLPIDTAYIYLPMLGFFAIVLLVGVIIHFNSKSWIKPFLGILFAVSLYTVSVDYIFNNVLKEHHRNRIDIILGKLEDHSGVGYNLRQAEIAIGSGGFFGKGYLDGTQTKGNFVPEQSTDFIFTSLAEEFGFVGSFFLISIFAAFLLRLLFLAERQRSKFARVYGYGVVSILFFHFAINIAMTIGLAPVIGIPLPFVSYGGSSLLSFTILVFIFLRLDCERLNVFR